MFKDCSNRWLTVESCIREASIPGMEILYAVQPGRIDGGSLCSNIKSIKAQGRRRQSESSEISQETDGPAFAVKKYGCISTGGRARVLLVFDIGDCLETSTGRSYRFWIITELVWRVVPRPVKVSSLKSVVIHKHSKPTLYKTRC